MISDMVSFAVVVPTLNGGTVWRRSIEALKSQRPAPGKVLVVDSGSNDGSDVLARSAGFDLVRIRKEEFDHGHTRQMATKILANFDVIVFMTQDAVLASSDTLATLVMTFKNAAVGTAYGRQLPRQGAGPIETHARLLNYPSRAEFRTLADARKLGLKVAFISNSFAAYRTAALSAVGGFPQKLILSEDMVVAAHMLQAGWTVAYVPEARVFHSHNYTLTEEFKRYFDIGVLHQNQSWLLQQFGKPEGEGRRFVRSEMLYLLSNAPSQLPSAFARTVAKYLSYKLGQYSRYFPRSTCLRLSMNRHYWD